MDEFIRFLREVLVDTRLQSRVLTMIRELKGLLWFLAFVLFMYVVVLGIQAVAPNGFF